MPRTEEERAGGFILARYNGHEWELPTLKRERERAWNRSLPSVLGPIADTLFKDWTPDADPRVVFGGANADYIDALADMIVAYDEQAVIGRDGVDTLDSDQIRDLFGRLYEIANPLDPDLQKALFSTALAVMTQALELARLAGASSTPGSPPASGSTPPRSIAATTPSKSSSSGTTRKGSMPRSVSAA